jgi:hypothetical protein
MGVQTVSKMANSGVFFTFSFVPRFLLSREFETNQIILRFYSILGINMHIKNQMKNIQI